MIKKLDRDEVRDLIGQGFTSRQIAERLGCHEDTIRRIRSEIGLSHPYRGRPMTDARMKTIWQMLFDGWSHKEIHRTEGIDVETIRKYFPGTTWTHQQAGEHQALLRRIDAPTYAQGPTVLGIRDFNAPTLATHRRAA